MSAFKDAFRRAGYETKSGEIYVWACKGLDIAGEDVATLKAAIDQAFRDRNHKEAIPHERPHKVVSFETARRASPSGARAAANARAASQKAAAVLEDAVYGQLLDGKAIGERSIHEIPAILNSKAIVGRQTIFEHKLARLVWDHARPNEPRKIRDVVSPATLKRYIAEANAFADVEWGRVKNG